MKYIKIRDVKSPTRGTPQSAGIDFYIPNDWNDGKTYELGPGERLLIPSGLKLKVPEGNALIAFNKSGVATKTGIIVGACVVDEDYQGEIHLSIINTNQPKEYWKDGYWATDSGYVEIEPGTKLMQFIAVPINYVHLEEVFSINDLFPEESERGSGGFGSTGLK